MAALQAAHTFLHLSLAHTEILPICDDSAVHRNTISRRLLASMEHSKEVSFLPDNQHAMCTAHKSIHFHWVYTSMSAITFTLFQYSAVSSGAFL